MTGALAGRRVVVPETRELEILARMLERHGATTIRCPLVAIADHPDQAPVEAWVRRFVADAPHELVLLTGEGLDRLLGCARRLGLEQAFLAALALPCKVTRGPKPAARLRALGLKPDLAATPTSAGMIAALAALDLAGHRVGVQLYPDNPGEALLEFLRGRGALADPVLPYVYGSAAEDRQVLDVVERMARGEVDLIAFTSSPQIRRLRDLARAAGARIPCARGWRARASPPWGLSSPVRSRRRAAGSASRLPGTSI